MPLFFFRICEGAKIDDADDEGFDLPNAEMARREAVRTAAAMLLERDHFSWNDAPWTMRVTDGLGGLVCNLQFSVSCL